MFTWVALAIKFINDMIGFTSANSEAIDIDCQLFIGSTDGAVSRVALNIDGIIGDI